MPGESLKKDLAELLNYWGEDTATDTADHILAAHLLACLKAFKDTSRARDIQRAAPPAPLPLLEQL